MIRQQRRFVGAILPMILLMLALAGCQPVLLSGQPSSDQLSQSALSNPEGLSIKTSPDSENRLLVLGADGNIYTVNPDGTDRFSLTSDASDSKQYLQPTWSPDAERIAWTEIEMADGEPTSTITTAQWDGSKRVDAEVPFAPFYIFWSPDSSRLAYLSNWLNGTLPSMALRLAELPDALDGSEELATSTLAQGQPLYFSWSPGGDQLLTHTGDEQLAFQALDGEREKIDAPAAAFPSPQWATSGEELVYAVLEDGLQRLIVTDLEGHLLNEITDYVERITFSLSPNGSQIAYIESDSDAGMAALGPLFVYDLESQQTRELSSDPTIAFYWSPDSEKLAYLTPDSGGQRVNFRWSVWDGEEKIEYADFLPSRTFFQSYLAFFDQYAQSMSIWSPDSSAFAYSGTDRGRSGVWVQPLGEGEPSKVVGQGVVVAWSPR
jgi:TolB protein